MKIAEVVSARSSCIRRQAGAILVKNDQIISTGYNGTARGTVNCDLGGCKRCKTPDIKVGERLDDCVCLHAEENTIIQAAREGISTIGSVLYCTYSPCLNCAKLIVNAGINAVLYKNVYSIGSLRKTESYIWSSKSQIYQIPIKK